jgi:hypothetical protein
VVDWGKLVPQLLKFAGKTIVAFSALNLGELGSIASQLRLAIATRAMTAGQEHLEPCYRCAYEHMGEVLNFLEHASSLPPSSEEFLKKVEGALDKLLEVERVHLGPFDPEMARRARELRKEVEAHLSLLEEKRPIAELYSKAKELRRELFERWRRREEFAKKVMEAGGGGEGK